MRIAIVAGAPGCGKTSLLRHLAGRLRSRRMKAGVFKLDALSALDEEAFREAGIPSASRLAGDVCPDHAAMTALGEARAWAQAEALDALFFETAGLCHRCSPFLTRVFAICVVSGLAHIGTPGKMRPIVEGADLVALSRAELISPAERQIMAGGLRRLNSDAPIIHVNGLTGEGSIAVAAALLARPAVRLLDMEFLRHPLPAGYCHHCQREGIGHA